MEDSVPEGSPAVCSGNLNAMRSSAPGTHEVSDDRKVLGVEKRVQPLEHRGAQMRHLLSIWELSWAEMDDFGG